MSQKEPLTVLFAPIGASGHIYPCVGIGEQLQSRGHRVVFAVDKEWRGRLTNHGFNEVLLNDPARDKVDRIDDLKNRYINTGLLGPSSSYDKLIHLSTSFCPSLLKRSQAINDQLTTILSQVKPDVVIFDNYATIPSLFLCDCPKIMLIPSNPLFNIMSPQLPPAMSGYPLNDQSDWQPFTDRLNAVIDKHWSDFNHWVKSFGLPDLPPHSFIYREADLNIYSLAEELDYNGLPRLKDEANGWKRPDSWRRFDSFCRDGGEPFELPENLAKLGTGKLIYLSLGSIGSIDVKLNKHLLGLLADTEYRVIVAKGPLADKYEVPANSWGRATLPQTRVLPLVDLFITHGGNNSVCESLYFGKPMIVMPLFMDQFDNAQRVVESGLGIRLNPYLCTRQELLEAIDKTLNDQQLAKRLMKIAERAQEEVKIQRVAKVIEELVEKKKKSNK